MQQQKPRPRVLETSERVAQHADRLHFVCGLNEHAIVSTIADALPETATTTFSIANDEPDVTTVASAFKVHMTASTVIGALPEIAATALSIANDEPDVATAASAVTRNRT